MFVKQHSCLSIFLSPLPSSPDSHRTAPITLDSFVPCAKTVVGFSASEFLRRSSHAQGFQIHARVFSFLRWDFLNSSKLLCASSSAASDCPPAPFPPKPPAPSPPASLHLLQLHPPTAGPPSSIMLYSQPLSFFWRLFSLPFLLSSSISDKDSPLWSEQVCPAPHPHSSFPLLLFLGPLLFPHYCTPDPLSCIITESHSLSQTSPCPLWRCNNIISRHVTSSALLPLSIRPLEAVPSVCLLLMSSFLENFQHILLRHKGNCRIHTSQPFILF